MPFSPSPPSASPGSWCAKPKAGAWRTSRATCGRWRCGRDRRALSGGRRKPATAVGLACGLYPDGPELRFGLATERSTDAGPPVRGDDLPAGIAAIGEQDAAGHIAGGIAGEEQHDIGDFRWLREAPHR